MKKFNFFDFMWGRRGRKKIEKWKNGKNSEENFKNKNKIKR